jgi:hypothetical protein
MEVVSQSNGPQKLVMCEMSEPTEKSDLFIYCFRTRVSNKEFYFVKERCVFFLQLLYLLSLFWSNP